MKVDVVGCMCTWCKKLSTSYIIDDRILFDAPQGSFKTLLIDYDILKFDYILISHFHSDHFADIHLVIDYLYHHVDKKVTIIAPKGCRERLISYFKVLEVGYLEDALNKMFNFIDCENNKIVYIDDYRIKIYKMTHQNLDAYGFTITKDGVTVGFSGDTAMCNNIRKILAKSKACFIDCSNITVTDKHLSVQEIKSLIEEFPNCKFYPVHKSIYSQKELDDLKIPSPDQGDVINID